MYRVNLPKQYKMTQPRYQPITNDQIPVIPLADAAGDVRVIAGDFSGTKGAASTFSPVNLWDVRLQAGKVADLTIAEGHNTILFVRSGQVKVGSEGAKTAELGMAQAALLTMEGTTVHLENTGSEEALLIVMGGEPLNEPIAARGPFVMNTEEELSQAMRDYREGRLGSHFD